MRKYITIILILFVSISFGQRKYAAEKYFEEMAYIKSAELYEKIYDRGDESLLVLSRLGDSYYYNSETEKSEMWYSKMFELHSDKEISSEYYFRYSQSLKTNGKYAESDRWLLKLKDINENDTRVKSLTGRNDYLSEFSFKDKRFLNVSNMGINTKYSDYGVFVKGNEIIFSSNRPKSEGANELYKWNKQPFLNLYKTTYSIELDSLGFEKHNFSEVNKLKGVNTRYHEASAIVTSDYKIMYFTRDNFNGKKLKNDKKRVSHLKLYKSELIDGEYKNIEELPFNSDDFSIGQPALSQDEKHIYFVSDMPGGYGYTDLYKVEILSDGLYGEVENLGGIINSEGREMFPYISNAGKLYFSSNGHIGLGSLDVFESDITESGYSTPINMGSTINSPKDDFAFVLNKENTRGYFSSNKVGGLGDDDIYSFEVYKCEVLLQGIVYDNITKKILPNSKVILSNSKGEVIAQSISDIEGKYIFELLACNGKYTVDVSKDDYMPNTKNIEIADISFDLDITLMPLIQEEEIVINPIYFNFDKHNIREDASQELDRIVLVMNNHPDMIIKIESHTDSRGSKIYNRLLSTRRAKSTKNYIVSKGIKESRIESFIGYGEDKLINDCDGTYNCSKSKHQENRRSHFYIIDKTVIVAGIQEVK
ncbi:MAG: OmpA family protein [Flavobacteriaceae bacterium]|nr:OmpA family protein [Flavobacteriaceae bacterium]